MALKAKLSDNGAEGVPYDHPPLKTLINHPSLIRRIA
jgi:hypothetical protein